AQALTYAGQDSSEEFFRQKLGDIDEPTAPFGVLDVHGDSHHRSDARQGLDGELARRIRGQARRLSVSAATLFHAAWAIVVARTSAREDVVYGTVLLGRLRGSTGAQRILGMFINTLPLRIRLQGIGAQELVRQTQRELVELLNHEQASLAVAQRCSAVTGSTPLFTTLLNYLHGSADIDEGMMDSAGMSLLESRGGTNYPITLSVYDQDEGFTLEAETDRSIDPQRILGYASEAMRALVEALEQAPDTPALYLSVLPQHERARVIEQFNATQRPYPKDKQVHELFEEQARRTPEAIALVYEGQHLSYGRLNDQADQLARLLVGKGLGPEQRAAVCVTRSPTMMMAQLAVLKSRATYIPMDDSYPEDRLSYMLTDSQAIFLLTNSSRAAKFLSSGVECIPLDGLSILPAG